MGGSAPTVGGAEPGTGGNGTGEEVGLGGMTGGNAEQGGAGAPGAWEGGSSGLGGIPLGVGSTAGAGAGGDTSGAYGGGGTAGAGGLGGSPGGAATGGVGGVLPKTWFAYISSETGLRRLHLMDPLPEPATRVILPPNSTETLDVTDFKFAPDGQFLAYRMGPGLHIARAPDWLDQAIEFSGFPTVTEYAWSPDSAVLAVAFTLGTDTYLGGVEVSGARSASGGGGAGGAPSSSGDGGSAGFAMFAPTMAPVDSELVWFQQGFVVFHTPDASNPTELRTLYFTAAGPRSFAAPIAVQETLYFAAPPLTLRPTDAGFFVTQPVTGTDFYAIELDYTVGASHGSNVVAPSGRYTGRAVLGELQIYRATDWSLDSEEFKLAGLLGCPKLLAWARDVERIACVANSVADPTVGEVRIFELGLEPAQLSMLAVTGDYLYSEAGASGWRRAVSPSGRWLAFTNQDYLYVADLAAQPPQVSRRDYWNLAANASAELLFSPDERSLLQHRGPELLLHSLETSELPIVASIGQTLAPPAQCTEEFADAPGTWCGSQRTPTNFIWSPNPEIAAFQAANGALFVVDFAALGQGEFRSIPVSSACSGPCIGQYDFQPQ